MSSWGMAETVQSVPFAERSLTFDSRSDRCGGYRGVLPGGEGPPSYIDGGLRGGRFGSFVGAARKGGRAGFPRGVPTLRNRGPNRPEANLFRPARRRIRRGPPLPRPVSPPPHGSPGFPGRGGARRTVRARGGASRSAGRGGVPPRRTGPAPAEADPTGPAEAAPRARRSRPAAPVRGKAPRPVPRQASR